MSLRNEVIKAFEDAVFRVKPKIIKDDEYRSSYYQESYCLIFGNGVLEARVHVDKSSHLINSFYVKPKRWGKTEVIYLNESIGLSKAVLDYVKNWQLSEQATAKERRQAEEERELRKLKEILEKL